MSRCPLTSDQVHAILSYLDLPMSDNLPQTPLEFLNKHLANLPPSLLEYFDFITPKQLTSIPAVKHRRLIYATSTPRPSLLSCSEGRLRWPLLWERLGGDPLAQSIGVVEEEDWANKGFMSDVESSQQVKKLGGFLRILEEEREAEHVREAKRMERRLDNQGEEFDEESDEEDADTTAADIGTNHMTVQQERPKINENQGEVEELFEKRLLEIFLDGMDTIDYSQIDYVEPPGGDPIALRDAEDRYFDDEEPSKTPNGHEQGGGILDRVNEPVLQNGQGDYDY
ncbi:uncharacterized protein IL334_001829 [Kwoniella shivajii]|uniref:CCD97-like C-terminal domain-containing protein n=1 Tax=Kwoniella shivajii TaxID=564305 RepID=A0ABZ1CU65_9TREE|nr:hypothetical protein IL334_001829 [Kwoniella shivajii]